MQGPENEEGSPAHAGRPWATQEAAEWLEHRRKTALAAQPQDADCVRTAKVRQSRPKAVRPKAADHEEAQRYRRPHLLQVEVGELLLNAACLNLQLAWYESARYFVSLHPSSAKLPMGHLPEVPTGEHLASQPQLSKSSQFTAYEGAELVQFGEKLEMHADCLDSHFVLFLWCCRSSLLREETVLLGYRPVPLREHNLYCRWATWDILGESEQQLAQLGLRLDVISPPGQIRLPHLTEVSTTGFTLNWSEPLGPSTSNYAVSVQPAEGAAALCRQSTCGHFVQLQGLLPGTTYVVDVRAMNQAGWGESCKLEASTYSGEVDSEAEEGVSATPDTRPNVSSL
ncbi:unnamed protein product [Effrenium voratum]|nr:unnamed protein product [Effrenium voratum]